MPCWLSYPGAPIYLLNNLSRLILKFASESSIETISFGVIWCCNCSVGFPPTFLLQPPFTKGAEEYNSCSGPVLCPDFMPVLLLVAWCVTFYFPSSSRSWTPAPDHRFSPGHCSAFLFCFWPGCWYCLGASLTSFSLFSYFSVIDKCLKQKGYARMWTHWDGLTKVLQISFLYRNPGKPSVFLLQPPLKPRAHKRAHIYKEGHISQGLILKPYTVRPWTAFPAHVPLSSTPSPACCFFPAKWTLRCS